MNTFNAVGEGIAMEPRGGHHPPRGRYLAAAFAFLFDRNGRLLLLSERESERKYMCDLPGGTLTVNEQPVAGLFREVFEETGLQIRLLSPLCWLKFDIHDTGSPILVAFYIAEATGAEVSLSAEHTGYRWATIEEIRSEKLEVSAGSEMVEASFARYRELTGRLLAPDG